MKIRFYTMGVTLLACGGLSSCVLDTDPVPEIPYKPRPVPAVEPPQEEPVQTTNWETAPAPSGFISAPTSAATTASTPAPAKPVTGTESAPATKKEQPAALTPEPVAPTPTATTAPAPEPAAPTIIPPVVSLTTPPAAEAPAPASNTAAPAADPKLITNTGSIPTAARVEGDPTRVWNPLDPSKKIRIINPKTNQPYPSGKKLKVRGTNFQFYVP